MPKVSIIIPVYNVEKYLPKCIDSVLHQSYKDIEIILVDDGSIDNSGKICDEYAAEDDRIVVFHTENRGNGAARNTGIMEAKCKYITFIDADDYIPSNYIEVLLNRLINENADVCICGFQFVPGIKKSAGEMKLSGTECMKRMLYGNTGIRDTPWGKLFKSEFFLNTKFDENINHSVDFEIFYRLYKNISQVVTTDNTLYFYVQRDSSVQHSANPEVRASRLHICDTLMELVDKEMPELKSAAIVRTVLEAIYLLDTVPNLSKERKKVTKALIKRFWKASLLDPEAPPTIKAKVVSHLICPFLTPVIRKARQKLYIDLARRKRRKKKLV